MARNENPENEWGTVVGGLVTVGGMGLEVVSWAAANPDVSASLNGAGVVSIMIGLAIIAFFMIP